MPSAPATSRAGLRPSLVLGLALGCLLPAAAPAEAKVARAFYGVEADPTTSLAAAPMTEADFARMRSARLGTLRVTFNWSGVRPTATAPANWALYDTTVERAARARVRILPVLIGSPSFAASQQSYAPTTSAGRAAFRRFARDVTLRYGRRGTFWRDNPRIPKRPITEYQIWNEPNYPPHWGDGPSQARDYASLLKLAANAIRGVDRRAKIVTAGLLAASTRGPYGYRYLDELYGVKGSRRYFDAVAIHPYSEDAAGIEGELSRIRRVMRRNRDRRTPVWITEVGWATGGGNPYFSMTPAEQAERLRSAFRLVVRKRNRYDVRRLIWFSWRDRPAAGREGWAYHCGLFEANGTPKPSYSAFRRFTRATR
jgi:hypothetical protein